MNSREDQSPLRPGALGANQLDHFIGAVSLTPGEVQEFGDPCHDRAALGRADDADASSAGEIEEPFVAKHVEGTDDGVLVHPEDRRQVDGRRKAFTLGRLAVGDRSSNLRRYLLVQREFGDSTEVGRLHRTNWNSTIIIDAIEEHG